MVSVSVSADLFRQRMTRIPLLELGRATKNACYARVEVIKSIWYVLEHANDWDIEPYNLAAFDDGNAK